MILQLNLRSEDLGFTKNRVLGGISDLITRNADLKLYSVIRSGLSNTGDILKVLTDASAIFSSAIANIITVNYTDAVFYPSENELLHHHCHDKLITKKYIN